MSIDLSAQGDVTIGGDVVGRDKIINNIQNIVQRALTFAEEADREKEIEAKYLAQGVSEFARRLQTRVREAPDIEKGSPYKGLLEYRLSDAEIFYGRSQAIAEVLEHLRQGPLTVLHAESGAGKSSLLQAGVAPRLIGLGHLPVYIRPYNVEPTYAIKRAFLPDLSGAPGLATASLREFLRKADSFLGEQNNLYIFLDQFEEFFTQLKEPERAEFVGELAECLDDEALRVRWLFSMRTEYFGNLANFRPRVRNPYENDFRLNRLTRAEAHEVVVEPAKRRGLAYEQGLVESLLDDLGTGADEVPPPQIQLVCSVLYDELPADSKQITRALYEGQGGAGGILRGHLERVLRRDLAAEQGPVARRVLEALISSEGHRLIRSTNRLLRELNASGQPIAPSTLNMVLYQLVESRLLRVHDIGSSAAQGYETTSGLSYELTHDYLLEQIKVDPAVQARKAAQELLEQETRNYERHQTLLSDDKLAILAPRQAELVVSEKSKELLAKSEAALKRRKGIERMGLGLVITLFVLGTASGLLAYFANVGRTDALRAQSTAQAQAAQAATQEQESEIAAQSASAQSAAAAAAAATAGFQATQAGGAQAAAESAAATATFREALANAVVGGLYENNGLVPVGAGPWEFAFDGQRLWVSNELNDTVQAIDPATGAVQQTVKVGRRPGALVFDGQYLWVVNQLDDTLQAIDPATLAVVREIQTDDRPAALLFDGAKLWVTNYSQNQVQAFDPQSGQRVGDPVPVGFLPWAMAFDGQRVWVANRNTDSLTIIDTRSPSNAVTLPAGGTPAGLAFDGNWMWVSLQNRHWVNALNPATREKVYTITVGLRPSALALDPVSGQLWVTNQGDNTVQVIDRLAGTASASVEVGTLPRALAFAGGRVWVANYSDNTVQAIDPVVGSAAVSIPVGTTPRGMAFDDAHQRLWVALGGENSVVDVNPTTGQLGQPIPVDAGPRALAFDGQLLWVVNITSNTVQAVNPETRAIVRTVLVGPSPRAILFAAELIWVANQFSDDVWAIDPATGEVKERVSVGPGPFDLAFDGQRIWVVNNGNNTVQAITPGVGHGGVPVPVVSGAGAVSFGGGYVWVNNFTDGSVQRIDPNSGNIGEPIQVGSFPASFVYAAGRMWVVNFGDNTVQAIDPETQETGRPVRVCFGPTALAFDGQRIWVSCRDSNTVQAISVNP
jgi:YVTN family beta-propeller protein